MLELHGERIAAGEHTVQEAQIRVLKQIGPQEGFKQGRNAGDQIRLLFDQKLGIGLDVELRNQNAGRAADQGRVDADA